MEILSGLRGLQFVVVNTLEYADYEVVALAATRLETAGKSWLYRTAPSFVPVLAGLGQKEPLSGAEIWPGKRRPGHGLVVVGSHTNLTNQQVEYARSHHELIEVELDASKVVADTRQHHIQEVAGRVATSLEQSNVLLITSRSVVSRGGQDDELALSRLVSVALTDSAGAPRWPRAGLGYCQGRHNLARRRRGRFRHPAGRGRWAIGARNYFRFSARGRPPGSGRHALRRLRRQCRERGKPFPGYRPAGGG